jgi:hypothetical protein
MSTGHSARYAASVATGIPSAIQAFRMPPNARTSPPAARRTVLICRAGCVGSRLRLDARRVLG